MRWGADRTVALKELLFLKGFFKINAFDHKFGSVLLDVKDFLMLDCTGHGAMVDHPFAGDAHNIELIPLDLIFDNMRDNVSRIASIGDDADFVGSLGQIIAQVQTAKVYPSKAGPLYQDGSPAAARSSWAPFLFGSR